MRAVHRSQIHIVQIESNFYRRKMFGLSLLKKVPTLVNTAITRSLKHDPRIRYMRGINQPPRFYKPGEENINRMPDEESRLWKEAISLRKIDAVGPRPHRKRRDPLDGRPQMKGIVLKTLIKKPKKPNSANRKCVLIRLSNGKEATAYVPGIGHNLQEHSNVLVNVHRTPDVPGLKLRVLRGVYDCAPLVKQPSIYPKI